MYCILEHGTKEVTRTLIEAVVRGCLGPALVRPERREVIDWLSTRDYRSADQIRMMTNPMPRFDLKVDILKGSLRAAVVGRAHAPDRSPFK